MNRWKSKVRALIALTEDQAGKPEGELAREKLRYILARHPEAREYEPVRAFMLSDIRYMRQRGISTDGSWTGRNLEEAVGLMVADYRGRIEAFRQQKRLIESRKLLA
jgi:hypothetical protein